MPIENFFLDQNELEKALKGETTKPESSIIGESRVPIKDGPIVPIYGVTSTTTKRKDTKKKATKEEPKVNPREDQAFESQNKPKSDSIENHAIESQNKSKSNPIPMTAKNKGEN